MAGDERSSSPTPHDPVTRGHPVGTGVGAVGGAVAGATAGLSAGPVGLAVGGVAGAVVGGLAGRAVAEVINPADEAARWNYHPPAASEAPSRASASPLPPGERGTWLQVLQPLAQSCLEEEEAYRACAAQAQGSELRILFEQRRADCQRGYRDLQALLQRLDGQLPAAGRASTALHRSWTSVKKVFSGHDDARLLAEAQRQVDQALAHYAQALRQTLPPEVHDLVTRQHRAVQRHHDELAALRARASTSH